MIGESLTWADAWVGKSAYSASWSIDFPPTPTMAKVWPVFYMEYYGNRVGMFSMGIVSIRRRMANDADETVSTGNAPAVFDQRMTSVTFGMYIYNCQARIVLDLGFWS
jgi:hypothetical protein